MKKIVFFTVLFFLFSSVYGLSNLRANIFIDSPRAFQTNILEVKVYNDGYTNSHDTIVKVSWCCGEKVFVVPPIEPNSYKTFFDVIVFPHAGSFDFNVIVDPKDEINEIDEADNFLPRRFFASLTKQIEQSSFVSLGDEPVEPISCNDTFLMGVGRKTNPDTNDFYRDSSGNLLRDPKNEDIWLKKQEGAACGSTSLAYVLHFLTGREFNQGMVDEKIRMAWGDGSFSDPFSIAKYAESQGVHARVFVDGSVEKLEWFMDNNIPVMVALSVTGSTSVLDGHWVVPVAHCLKQKQGLPNSFERIIGFYNPWGYQQQVSYEKFNHYWGRQDLGKIPLWNRVFVAFYKGSPPSGMPSSNVDSWVGLKMSTSASLSQFMVGIQDFGNGFVEMFTEDFFHGLGRVFVGLGKAVWNLVTTVVQFIVALIAQLFDWLWGALKTIGCWIYGLFGGSCEHVSFHEHSLFSSSECGESSVFLNGFVLNKPIAYISKVQKQGFKPLFLYKLIKKDGELKQYLVSNKVVEEFSGFKAIKTNLLGFVSEQQGVGSIDLTLFLKDNNVLVDGSIGFGFDSWDENKVLLWSFLDSKARGFVSTNPCAKTKSFLFALSGKDDVLYWVYTRNKILGYVSLNESTTTSKPLFRFYDSKHQTFYPTLDLNEGINKGYSFSGLIGFISGGKPINTQSFYSTEFVCNDSQKPLYRYQNTKTKDYFLTTELLNNTDFNLEKKLGCIDSCPTKCTTPLWEYKTQEIKKD